MNRVLTQSAVSSSHAIVGSIIILSVFVFGADQIRWDSLWDKIIIPMAISPIIAILIAFFLYSALLRSSNRSSLVKFHWISAGSGSFARGINDASKIAALGAFFYITGDTSWSPYELSSLFATVAGGMTLGSLFAGRRVTETLAERITLMSNAEGLASNATTAFLVISASGLGLPVSTTHVISSSIIGIGTRRKIKSISWKTLRRMALAWLVTLPTSGAMAATSYLLLHYWI